MVKIIVIWIFFFEKKYVTFEMNLSGCLINQFNNLKWFYNLI